MTICVVAMDRYRQLLQLVRSFEEDFRKFYEKQNISAGIRLRKHMQELRRFAKDVRDEVQQLRREWRQEKQQKGE